MVHFVMVELLQGLLRDRSLGFAGGVLLFPPEAVVVLLDVYWSRCRLVAAPVRADQAQLLHLVSYLTRAGVVPLPECP